MPKNETRFAFVVSKKIGNAVTRNRVKRRLRSIVRSLRLKNGWYLFLDKPPIKDVKFSILTQEVDRCLGQLKF